VRRHGAYLRPGSIDPWVHNRIVRRRKQYERIAREIRASKQGMTRAFRELSASALRAADSLRDLRGALETLNRGTR
jgi:hypothetical protein